MRVAQIVADKLAAVVAGALEGVGTLAYDLAPVPPPWRLEVDGHESLAFRVVAGYQVERRTDARHDNVDRFEVADKRP
jgi:hypothetical protein